jgi:hypothetical protein
MPLRALLGVLLPAADGIGLVVDIEGKQKCIIII